MPFPVAHALLGASIVVAGRPKTLRANAIGLQRLALGAFLAILPDFDYLGIWFLHFPKWWHRGASHSLLAALAGGMFFALLEKSSRIRWAIVYATAMASHGLLDALLSIRTGAALFWPLSRRRFAAGVLEYPDTIRVQYYASLDMLVIRDGLQLLKFSAVEFAGMGALFLLTWVIKGRFEKRTP